MPDEDIRGLTSSQAEQKLTEFGPNELPEKPPPSDVKIFLSQLKNPFVYILLVAAIITVIIGHISDAGIIGSAVIINTFLGFIQERRAGRALEALKKLVRPQAKVIRDGKQKIIGIENIVPGDTVVLAQGDKIPADGKMVEANRFFVDEAILTGESVPVSKKDQEEIFMGTIVSGGRGFMEVAATGGKTRIGSIALTIQEPAEDTPLRKQVKKLSRDLSILVFALTAFVFVIGFVGGNNVFEMFTTSVALAVSAIPEGLLVGLTVVLAIGMQRILKRKGLIRNLESAETLGGVTTICVDKTGTLTEGKMRVIEVLGETDDLAEQAVVANDLDDPLVIAAHEWGKQYQGLVKKHRRLDSIPFSPKDRFAAYLNKGGGPPAGGNTLFVNGAPEYLLDWTNLGRDQKSEIKEQIKTLTGQGRRLIGMARKTVADGEKRIATGDVKSGLEWVGMLAFSDPVRAGVRQAFEETTHAGIKLIVITGDYKDTALSIVRNLGIEVDEREVIEGEKLATISIEQLAKRLDPSADFRTRLFTRTTPEQKLKIIEALKANGEVVAMMGDGVNDAPALKKADIGIVVGEASDVAREIADLVLLDSSFATIAAVVEEGRGIFDNIRKIILYLMCDAFSEIVAVLGTIILRLPLPVTAGQILWINIVSDGFPDLALTIDPKAPDIMKRKPRSADEALAAPWMKYLILIVSLAGGLIALAVFVIFYRSSGDEILARSMAFGVLGLNSLFYVYSIRTLDRPVWRQKPLENTWLNLAVLGGLAFQITPYFFEASRSFLRITSLAPMQWGVILAASVSMFVLVEVTKELVNIKKV
ncbi:hypothetical protein A2630_03925 [Candidatus Woesebacteria bacterium RIFCSPHIGHO2_01_FULL_44_10]|uniref:Cation-transporting P-type ATPase N-terminal domain-containing protein n=1 Tax=Candidatus Woesebacteria bacterium RIFCSPLOWO2_01_FULL_44_14 TaxID=1802525 RepID=A0A1F8C0W3_9BACT|nr:MAG: hypothetical protein A2630_03925 [Candidatus Woesebacteria bacterium RIFCSPHIGHO2_01_FULL_44_10]OGM69770.1 MAG: hypothetical protein A2975_00230 [Candidatus Woesebacteria bacterium RIFCSPLOWO2_01_FULL_44_14]